MLPRPTISLDSDLRNYRTGVSRYVQRRTSLATALLAITEWAVAMEFRADNPCAHIGPVLGPLQAVVQQKCGS